MSPLQQQARHNQQRSIARWCHLGRTVTILFLAVQTQISFVSSFLSSQFPIRNHLTFHKSIRFLLQTYEGAGDNPLPAPRMLPTTPSQLFRELASSQLELLAASLIIPGLPGNSKVKTVALYLPQENDRTGQLEFLPAVIYPDPSHERIFIASDAASGMAPALPKILTKLPGFAQAASLIPDYPLLSSTQAGAGAVEEVMCDIRGKSAASLSTPLLSGPRTIGVLLVSPCLAAKGDQSVWSDADREQVARAAKSLSLALSMEEERANMEQKHRRIAASLSDSLHQLKNPVQALRTYGKILQRQLAADYTSNNHQILELADHLMIQSDRLEERIKPVDALVGVMQSEGSMRRLLAPASTDGMAPDPWQIPLLPSSTRINNKNNSSSNNKTNSVLIFDRSPLTRRRDDEVQPEDSARAPYLDRPVMSMVFMEDILSPIISAFRAIAVDRNIYFDVHMMDDLPGLWASAETIQEVTSNLLDNAFKYVLTSNSESPHVRLRVEPIQGGRRGVVITISDNGPGVPAAEAERIFERGYRSPSIEDKVEGTGIGLDIAQTLVNQMGGRLRLVLDGVNHGATFEVTIYSQLQNS